MLTLKRILILLLFCPLANLTGQAPGGVAGNLVMWLKADAGTNTTTNAGSITSWNDQSGNGNNASNLGTSPLFRRALCSYNPGIDFTGRQGLSISNTPDINTSSNTAKSIALVIRTGSDVNTRQLIYEEGGGTHGLNLYLESGNLFANLWVSRSDNAGSVPVAANTTYAVMFVYDGGNTRWDLYLNGSLAVSDVSVQSSLPSHGGAIGLGEINATTRYDGNNVGSGDVFQGSIMEMAYYNAHVLSASERSDITSYLGIKYGISLSQDYNFSSGGAVYWDQSLYSTYSNGVAGWIRDDNSGLNQKQGKSTGMDALVSMAYNYMAYDNLWNFSSIPNNGDYMLWGHDGGDISSFDVSGAPAGYAILGRTWMDLASANAMPLEIRVPDNSSSGTALPAEQNNVYLIADTDADFTSGAISIAMSATGNEWQVSASSSTAYRYFTIATDALNASLGVAQQGDESGTTSIIFSVSLSGTNNTGSAITFDLSDAGSGTATSGSDYVAIPPGATISVAPGSATGYYTVNVIDDAVTENTESLEALISNPSSGLVNITSASATANIADDDVFTGSPGGVSANLNMWLRADLGTSTAVDNAPLNTWSDLSGNGNDAVSDGGPPTYFNNASYNINFNPCIDFDDVNDRLIADLRDLKSGGTRNYAILAVGMRRDANVNIIIGSGTGTNDRDLYFGYLNGSQATLTHWPTLLTTNASTWNVPAPSPFVLSAEYNGSGRVLEELREGNLSRNTDNHTTDLKGNNTTYIGYGENPAVGYFNGVMSEIIVYNGNVTSLEKLQLHSYLALKYGLMPTDDNDADGLTNELISGSVQEGDMLASDGTTLIWDYSAMGAAYFNDIAGIGLDNTSGLNQKQSKSRSSDALVTIGLGNIAASNPANGNSFSQSMDFLVWGNNDASLSGVSSNLELPLRSGAVDKLQRVWKVRETGSVGTVEIAVPKDSIDKYFTSFSKGYIYLRVADDENLSTNAVNVLLSERLINGVPHYSGTYDFNGTRYFGIIQGGFIVWTGSEWRGGMSLVTDHAASDEPEDSLKPLYIMAGDTASILEAVVVDSVDIETGAVMQLKPLTCLRTSKITSSGSFVLEADSTGFAQYKGPAVTGRFEQYIDNDGWHQIGSPFSNTTWGDLVFGNSNGFVNHPVGGVSTDSCNYCNLWWYDTSTDNGSDIGFAGSTAYGTWRSSSGSSEAFVPNRGWNLYLDVAQNFGSAPWTISFTGSFNAGTVSQTVNENNSGWNLVANPYPSLIDWDVVDDDLAAAQIAPGYYVWDHENTNFAVYANGSGTLGATRYIAPMQGFYVQTATAGGQGTADVFHSFDLDDGDRPNPCQTAGGNIFKSGLKVQGQLKLRTTHGHSGKVDEMLLQFNDLASRGFDPNEDIRKLLSSYKDVPSVYAWLEGAYTSITALPLPFDHDSLELGVHTNDKAQVRIEVMEKPAGMSLFLEDLKTGKWHLLDQPLEFEHDARLEKRFVLHFGMSEVKPRNWTAQNPFSIHVDQGFMVLETLKRITDSDWYLTDISGQVVAQGRVDASTGTRQEADLRRLKAGVYVFVLFEADNKYVEKLPVVQ